MRLLSFGPAKWLQTKFVKPASEFVALPEKMAALRDEVTSLRGEIVSLRGDVVSRQGEVDSLRTEIARSSEFVDAQGQPNLGPLSPGRRNERIVAWNIKNLGYEMARLLAGSRPAIEGAAANLQVTSRTTRQADFETPWFAYWCAQLKMAPIYHRKIWEYCFLLQSLHDEGLLVPGKTGLGFACGREPIPSYLASRGVIVTATDLAPEDVVSKGWDKTNEHAAGLETLWHPHLVDRDLFGKAVSFLHVDANRIPPSLAGYDFCWSICALEHLGSIEKGLAFIENSLAVLRPGGVAIHTTEFNLDNEGPTIDNWLTVLFQRKHIEALAESLTAQGHDVAPLNFDFGDGPLDNFIDIPPYHWNSIFDHPQPAVQLQHPSHLKLAIDGFACTCFGLVVRKKK